jgi:hypothetical protein
MSNTHRDNAKWRYRFVDCDHTPSRHGAAYGCWDRDCRHRFDTIVFDPKTRRTLNVDEVRPPYRDHAYAYRRHNRRVRHSARHTLAGYVGTIDWDVIDDFEGPASVPYLD